MRVLVLQLKRIGDLVLTTPALAALKAAGATITLIADGPCGSLLPAIPGVDEALVYERHGDNRHVWQRLRQRDWDVCYDFTGTDRSAFMAWLSRAPRRVTFQYVRKHLLRRIAYHEFVDSPVRLAHTCDHCLDLVAERKAEDGERRELALPALALPAGIPDDGERDFVLVHPGTARPEKYWLQERWREIIAGLGSKVIVTTGPDAFEKAHAAEIAAGGGCELVQPASLLALSALVERARLVVSCDTAVVHIAAAFRRPQIALFGPTNPFHWRPRHDGAVVISAASPGAPLTQFFPKMKGAPMAALPVGTVLRAARELLGHPPTSASEGSS